MQEELQVMGTSYTASRVRIEESTESNAAPMTSVAWIAAEVGLVRLELGEGEHATTIELASVRTSP